MAQHRGGPPVFGREGSFGGHGGAVAETTLTPETGRPAVVLGQVALGQLPPGEFAVLVDVYSGPKLLTSQRVTGRRTAADFAPAAAPPNR